MGVAALEVVRSGRQRLRRVPGAVWLIIILALVVRVVAVAATHGYSPLFDAADYDRTARSIAHGDGYPESILVPGGGPTAFTPPGYPLVLAAIYVVSGDSWTAGRLIQALFGVSTVILIGVVAWKLWGRRAGLASMGIASVSPFLLFPDVALLSEPLFTVFVFAALIATLEQRDSAHAYRWALVAGVFAGLATLTRTNGVVILLPLALATWTRSLKPSPGLIAPVILVGSAILVIAPWTIRNAVATHGFVPLSTRDGEALVRTYNDVSRTASPPSTPHPPEDRRIYFEPGITEVEANAKYRSAALRYMREHPGYVAETIFRNTLRALQLQDVNRTRSSVVAGSGLGIPAWFGDAAIYSFYPVAILALAGAFLPAARRSPMFVWAIPLLLFASVVLIADGRARYRSPVDPFLVMLAGLAAAAIWDRLRPEGSP